MPIQKAEEGLGWGKENPLDESDLLKSFEEEPEDAKLPDLLTGPSDNQTAAVLEELKEEELRESLGQPGLQEIEVINEEDEADDSETEQVPANE